MRHIHGRESVPCAPPPAVRDGAKSGTGRVLSEARRHGRTLASQALSASGVVQARAARALGVDPSRVGDWYDPEHESTLQSGDLLALPYEDAARILAALGAANELRRKPVTLPAHVAALVTMHDAGEIIAEAARDALDQVIDADEARRLERLAAKLDSSTAQLRAALRGVR